MTLRMPNLLILTALLLVLFSPEILAAENDANTSSTGFNAFKLVIERNIFDPNRTVNHAAAKVEEIKEASPTAEHLNLLGTFVSPARSIAFIDGPSALTNSSATLGTTITQWRITQIDSGSVELTKADQKLVWPVGRRIEREPGKEWQLAATDVLKEDDTPTSGSTSDTGSAGMSETARKMMERRKKEDKS